MNEVRDADYWQKQAERAVRMLRAEAARYVKEDGTPGDLSCCWGWRDSARRYRQMADDIEKGWKKGGKDE